MMVSTGVKLAVIEVVPDRIPSMTPAATPVAVNKLVPNAVDVIKDGDNPSFSLRNGGITTELVANPPYP